MRDAPLLLPSWRPNTANSPWHLRYPLARDLLTSCGLAITGERISGLVDWSGRLDMLGLCRRCARLHEHSQHDDRLAAAAGMRV